MYNHCDNAMNFVGASREFREPNEAMLHKAESFAANKGQTFWRTWMRDYVLGRVSLGGSKKQPTSSSAKSPSGGVADEKSNSRFSRTRRQNTGSASED
ncbi:hypothetical protein FF38_02244 [Lucilia cuprina]|uniref:Uncharacterized protein n=1 Tax=Lucilia cuprina TaxID=7375 RepID=A0A0L0C890_LUCCU|nr:hypothetical protein FF38_02244 [Lucilia cuprina]